MKLRCAAVILGLLVLPSTFSGAQSQDIASVVEELTLQEKACLITGMNKWETCAVPRSGIPAVWMADGPVGLRKNLGAALTDSVPAICFPSAAAIAAALDLEMPGNPLTPPIIRRAVEAGALDEADLDRAVGRVLQLVARRAENEERPKIDALAANHRLAHQVAVEQLEQLLAMINSNMVPEAAAAMLEGSTSR